MRVARRWSADQDRVGRALGCTFMNTRYYILVRVKSREEILLPRKANYHEVKMMNYEEISNVARILLSSERELLNQRMTWLSQTQGLLFASLAFSWDKSPALSTIIATLGAISALSIGYALTMISPATQAIYDWWHSQIPEEDRKSQMIVPIWGPSKSIPKPLRPERILPVLFFSSWTSVIIIILFFR